ncbi:MAG TPA: hypothetical protein VM536_02300, partial [Chloroflexia bacterium]|nr:hypothetical protein [Chloroflexia bacterium]
MMSRRRIAVTLAVSALLPALLDGLVCARAALGRTQSWSFPIDDAYIYANYARAAGAGQWFQYNPGEPSGGVTGLGWLLLLWAAHPLTALLGPVSAAFAPASVRDTDPALALEGGRLFLTAYGLGGLLLGGAALATGWLAYECLRDRGAHPLLPGVAAVLSGAALLADRQVIWGAYSGLELPLSFALLALAPATLLWDLRRPGGPRLWWSPLAAAVLPWARPELVVAG